LFLVFRPEALPARLEKDKGSATFQIVVADIRCDSDISVGVIAGRARDWPDEKLHQNSVFDFGGSDLYQRFCGRAYSAKLQKNR
jgi:hypothetical protein